MSGYRRDHFRNLYDTVTGARVGYVDSNGNEVLNASPLAGITARGRASQIGHSFQGNGYIAGQVTSLNALQWANTQLPVPMDIVGDYGVPGSTIQQMIDTQIAQALADDTDIVDVDTGVNDLVDANATGVDIAGWEARVRQAVQSLCAAKRVVLWRSIDPASIVSADRALEAPMYNEVTARVLSEFPNAIFVDSSSALQDPASSSYQPNTALVYDGRLHPNTAGSYRRGLAIVKAMRGRARITPGYSQVRQTLLPAFGTSTGTAVPNSGTITQTNPIPAGYTLTINNTGSTGTLVVVTTVAPSGTQPKRLRLTITTAGANSIQLSNTSTALTGAVLLGEIMRAFAKIRLLGQTGVVECSLLLNRNGQLVYANQFNSAVEVAANGGVATWPTESIVAMLRTVPTVSLGTSGVMSVTLLIRFNAAGGATLDIYDGIGVETLIKS